jgi:hypothetical protein
MDIVSHALWGGTIVRKRPLLWWAFFFGALPDIISTGIGSIYYFFKTGSFLPENWWALLPTWSKNLYFWSHSVFGAAIILAILFFIGKRFTVLILPYLLHIGMDLFAHKGDQLSRLLYPLVRYKMERVSGLNWWEHSWIWLANIALLIGINLFLWYKNKRRSFV